MSNISRIVGSLTAIHLTTSSLPLFSWSLSPSKSASQHVIATRFLEACPATKTTELRSFLQHQLTSGGKDVFFMGEHHHQPAVLAAQLCMLDELSKAGRDLGREVVLVMEQFNVLQQGLLDGFRRDLAAVKGNDGVDHGSGNPGNDNSKKIMINERDSTERQEMIATRFIEDYQKGEEGFSMGHYLPLLVLAQERDVIVKGGFPPRNWARIVAREGSEALKSGAASKVLEQLGFMKDRWNVAFQGCDEHKAYVRSMVREEAPWIIDDSIKDQTQAVSNVGPGEAINNSNLHQHEARKKGPAEDTAAQQHKGLYPAQAFKDSMLAFVIDEVLSSRNGKQQNENATQKEQNISNPPIVMVIAGSGHCEYRFGAPERLKSIAKENVCLLVCKSKEESQIWQSKSWAMRDGIVGDVDDHDTTEKSWQSGDKAMADAVYCYDAK